MMFSCLWDIGRTRESDGRDQSTFTIISTVGGAIAANISDSLGELRVVCALGHVLVPSRLAPSLLPFPLRFLQHRHGRTCWVHLLTAVVQILHDDVVIRVPLAFHIQFTATASKPHRHHRFLSRTIRCRVQCSQHFYLLCSSTSCLQDRAVRCPNTCAFSL